MTNPTINQLNEQFDKFFGGPVRAFAELSVNHLDAVVSTQMDAAKAYADLGIRQARTALDIREPQDVQKYVQGQQEVAKELGERVKGDAEKVVALNQKFAEEAQKLSQQSAQNVQSVQKAATSKTGGSKSTGKQAAQTK